MLSCALDVAHCGSLLFKFLLQDIGQASSVMAMADLQAQIEELVVDNGLSDRASS